ncbi:polysaccharide deacetylase family protein [Granulosicoccus sp.]|nr:polysaccharide deacetylase family protein [Granulosicoccus sp.]
MSVVLMYHGIFPDADTRAIDAEDLPYAVSVSDFTRQLDELAQRKTGLFSEGASPDVVISFDDEHASNLQLAAPLLIERQLAAYFFITTDFIGKRSGFMSCDELRELSMMPGMCIGSHGMTHRFFDDMTEAEAINELTGSREQLETICQSACQSISFPGGRFTQAVLDQVVAAGYTQVFGSEIGLFGAERWEGQPLQRHNKTEMDDRWQLAQQCGFQPLERVAIRRTTQISEFQRIIAHDKVYFRRKQFNSFLKHFARRIIGNRLYHGLYKSIAAR